MYKLLLNIKFYINNIYNLYIYITRLNKINLSYDQIAKYLSILNENKLFNLRNKLNFGKSGRKLNTNKKSGHSRMNKSSSHILKNGIVWFGFRHINIYKNNIFNILNKLFICMLFNKRSNLLIYNLEIVKFLYNITKNISFLYINLNAINTNINLIYYEYKINNYKSELFKYNNINFIY